MKSNVILDKMFIMECDQALKLRKSEREQSERWNGNEIGHLVLQYIIIISCKEESKNKASLLLI